MKLMSGLATLTRRTVLLIAFIAFWIVDGLILGSLPSGFGYLWLPSSVFVLFVMIWLETRWSRAHSANGGLLPRKSTAFVAVLYTALALAALWILFWIAWSRSTLNIVGI